jgi:dCMP deaminase
MSPLASPAPTASPILNRQTICFSNTTDLLKFVTKNWMESFVTTDLSTRELIEPFVRRPFFMLLSTDAPLFERYNRSKRLVLFSFPL